MNFDQFIGLINALVPLFQLFIWPVFITVILLHFSSSIKKFIENINKVSAKVSSVEVDLSAEHKETIGQVTAAITAATIAKETENIPQDINLSDKSKTDQNKAFLESTDKVLEIGYSIGQALTPQVAKQAAKTSLLWVDDNLGSTTFERNALKILGIHVTTSSSTEEALEKTRLNEYDIVISNMARSDDNHTGYRLLEELQSKDVDLYFILYASADRLSPMPEKLKKGVFAQTNNPQELFILVIRAIREKLALQNVLDTPASTRAYLAEEAVLTWLNEIIPPEKASIEISRTEGPDFIINNSDGTKTGIEVKSPSSNFSTTYISKLFGILNHLKRRVDSLNVFLVFSDASFAMDAFQRLQTMTIPPKISITFGHIYRGKFQHDASLSDTEPL